MIKELKIYLQAIKVLMRPVTILGSLLVFIQAFVKRLALFMNTIAELVTGLGFFAILTLLPAIF